MKTCNFCKIEQNSEAFYKHKKSKDGLSTKCKKCEQQAQHKYYLLNSDSIKAASKAYLESNRETCYATRRKYYAKNPDKMKQKRLKHKAKRKIYIDNRLKTDIEFKLACVIRKRVNQAVRSTAKAGSSIKELGCSLSFLKDYLESKFQPGMTWENYGKTGWHIDHIKPLVSFTLSDVKDFKRACHYSNLQPLWAVDNLRKGAK